MGKTFTISGWMDAQDRREAQSKIRLEIARIHRERHLRERQRYNTNEHGVTFHQQVFEFMELAGKKQQQDDEADATWRLQHPND